MTVLKSGDLVVLRSGGPVMTVDTINTDIFDDNKITGVLCVWFVADKLERVRFDHGALELASPPAAFQHQKDVQAEEGTGDYKIVLDEMAAAMNLPEAETIDSKPVSRRPRRSSAGVVAHSSVGGGAGD
jgi:uncharacterized protein YodC (DUF2158 family)